MKLMLKRLAGVGEGEFRRQRVIKNESVTLLFHDLSTMEFACLHL